MILKITEAINSDLAVSSDDAVVVENLLLKKIEEKEQVTLDFTGIDTLTTAFLNVAIGTLYARFDPTTLNAYIKIDGKTLTALQRDKVRLVMENAKTKLSNEELDNDED